MKNIPGIGGPPSTNIGEMLAILWNGSAIITVRGFDGKANHVSEGLTPAVGVVT